jgi:SagB-type dehydrogenase family enzyme
MHVASSLEGEEEVRGLRTPTPPQPLPEPRGKVYPLSPIPEGDMPDTSIEETIRHRGSTRVFAREAITFPQLSTILDRATRGVSADFLDPYGSTMNWLYLIVNAVDGLPSGSYLYRREGKALGHGSEHALELLREDDYRRRAGYLGLEQDIPADASANVFFLADLDSIVERYGNRGYRMAQLEAGIIGGRLYLAAYAQRLGASGLTFYDDDVIEFFSPWAEGKSVMFMVALGISVKRGA